MGAGVEDLMGRVILCASGHAQKPYVMKTSGVRVYTIEELCYCLKEDLDLIDENTIDREMALFIRDELGLTERGKLLEELVLSRDDIKSRLVVIFCSADYYNKEEITAICDELDELAHMIPVRRKKRRADSYMIQGRLNEAAAIYRNIAGDPEAGKLSQEEYGNVLHNIGVYYIRSRMYTEASRMFREAYERNDNKYSLKCYLYSLKLGHNESLYIAEAMRLLDNSELIKTVEAEIANAGEKAGSSAELEEMKVLEALYKQGLTTEFDRLSGEMIGVLKARYRANGE
ncbi:MAG: hypothetical protein K6G81_05265 [Lachnospiraceae bacterium]|nr:hypothetical protein [Lachnospiraceae bacterium]